MVLYRNRLSVSRPLLRWPRLVESLFNVTVWRPSVCLSVLYFSNLDRARGVFFNVDVYANLCAWKAAYIHINTIGLAAHSSVPYPFRSIGDFMNQASPQTSQRRLNVNHQGAACDAASVHFRPSIKVRSQRMRCVALRCGVLRYAAKTTQHDAGCRNATHRIMVWTNLYEDEHDTWLSWFRCVIMTPPMRDVWCEKCEYLSIISLLRELTPRRLCRVIRCACRVYCAD